MKKPTKPTALNYLAVMGMSYQCKNKLEHAVLAYLKTLDRTLVTALNCDLWRGAVEAKIDALEAEHHRCKPLRVHWQYYENELDLHLRLNGICNFTLYAQIQ